MLLAFAASYLYLSTPTHVNLTNACKDVVGMTDILVAKAESTACRGMGRRGQGEWQGVFGRFMTLIYWGSQRLIDMNQ
jgi:hypothetical protein